MMKLLRTPEVCFENLPDYPFKPHYQTINDRWEPIGNQDSHDR